MQACSTIKSPVCAHCGGECCRFGHAIRLTATDVKRIAKKTGQPLQRTVDGQPTTPEVLPEKPYEWPLGGRERMVVGSLQSRADNDCCIFSSKKGCTLGEARPIHCRVYFCAVVLEWAEHVRDRASFATAIKVLEAAARRSEPYPASYACRGWAREYRVRARELKAQLVS